MSKIGIIGLGKIGGRLAETLLSLTDVKEIWLDTYDKKKLTGFLLSLRVTAALIKSNVQVVLFDFNRLNELDLIIVCVKDHYDPRHLISLGVSQTEWLPNNLRYVGFFQDYPLLKNICDDIKSYQGLVAVVTNPVELNTFFVATWLPKARVVGLGASVDASRFLYCFSKSINLKVYHANDLIEIQDFESIKSEFNDNCVIAGEHGFELIPISNMWCRSEYLAELSDQDIKTYMDESVAIGFDIVKSMGYTLHDCIPAFLDDIRWLLQAGNQKCFRSFAVPTINSCVTRPIKIGINQKIIEFDDYTPSELARLENIKDRLKHLIQKVATYYSILTHKA